jgi:CheY-like chemotaxis protein
MGTEKIRMKSILLAEDDPRDAELTLTALEENHLANQVTVVENGEEALDYLFCRGKFEMRETGNPLFVLLDNKMPKVNGLEVLKIIKADEDLKTIPVVGADFLARTPGFGGVLQIWGERLRGETGGFFRIYDGGQRNRRLLGGDQ